MQIWETTGAHAAFQRKNENCSSYCQALVPNILIFCFFFCVFPASLFVHEHPIEIRARVSALLDQTKQEQASLHNNAENRNKKANIWSASRRNFMKTVVCMHLHDTGHTKSERTFYPSTGENPARDICFTVSSSIINPNSRVDIRSGFNRAYSYSCRDKSLRLTFPVNFLIMLMHTTAGKALMKPSFDYLFISSFTQPTLFFTFIPLSWTFPWIVLSVFLLVFNLFVSY